MTTEAKPTPVKPKTPQFSCSRTIAKLTKLQIAIIATVSILLLSGLIAGIVIGSRTQSKESSNSDSQPANPAPTPTGNTLCVPEYQLVVDKYLVNNSLTTKQKLSNLTATIKFNSTGITDEDVLVVHNTYRSLLGKPPMTISAAAKAYAQNYSAYLAANNVFVHSNGPYGENLYFNGGSSSIISAMKAWWNEYPNYNGELIPSGNFAGYGHYTQMIWDSSIRVGCGQAKSKTGKWYTCCSYDPPGNYNRRNVSVVINGTVC